MPRDNADLSFLVYDLQRSNKTVLSVNTEQTSFSSGTNDDTKVNFYYPEEAFLLRLRAYISTILPFLKCRMDVQTADKKGMLMRYVTDYVSKFKDSQTRSSLYSTHVTPAMAAYKHLSDMKPCEPEMLMTLSSLKIRQ